MKKVIQNVIHLFGKVVDVLDLVSIGKKKFKKDLGNLLYMMNFQKTYNVFFQNLLE